MGTKGEWRGAPASYSRCRKWKDWIEECKLIRQRAHVVRNYWNDSVTSRFYREILTMNTDMERMRKQSPYLLFSRKKREGGCTFSCFLHRVIFFNHLSISFLKGRTREGQGFPRQSQHLSPKSKLCLCCYWLFLFLHIDKTAGRAYSKRLIKGKLGPSPYLYKVVLS